MHDDKVERFLDDPESSALFLDFDGTLSEIVMDPAAARPAEGAPEALAKARRRLGLVAVVSGRSAEQLLDWLGSEIEIWGVHGAERVVGGQVALAEELGPHLDRIARARKEAGRLLAGDEGVIVEDKRSIITLHYRQAPDTEAARRRIEEVARELVERYGFTTGTGRMVVELKAPVDFSKADVVRKRARETSARAVAFVGDDTVDLPAFDALDELEAEGRICLRVAVESEESPPVLLERADLVVPGPAGVVAFLERLGSG